MLKAAVMSLHLNLSTKLSQQPVSRLGYHGIGLRIPWRILGHTALRKER